MGRFIAPAKRQTIDTPIDVILLSAGQGRRIKSFGSKSLFNVGGKSLIEHQVEIISSTMPHADVIAVLGYELDRIYKVVPNSVRVVENTEYESSTSTKSAMIGIRACAKNDVLIINGDIWFNNKALEIVCGETSVLADEERQITDDKIGLATDRGYVSNFGFGMELMWGQMIYLHSGDIDLFSKICYDNKQEVIISEVFNTMISKGCEIKCVTPNKYKIVEIDTVRDLERIK